MIYAIAILFLTLTGMPLFGTSASAASSAAIDVKSAAATIHSLSGSTSTPLDPTDVKSVAASNAGKAPKTNEDQKKLFIEIINNKQWLMLLNAIDTGLIDMHRIMGFCDKRVASTSLLSFVIACDAPPETCAMLLDRGANTDFFDLLTRQHNNPNFLAILRLFYLRGVNFLEKSFIHTNALHCAATGLGNHPNLQTIIEALTAVGVNIEERRSGPNKDTETPLKRAIFLFGTSFSQGPVVKYLVASGADASTAKDYCRSVVKDPAKIIQIESEIDAGLLIAAQKQLPFVQRELQSIFQHENERPLGHELASIINEYAGKLSRVLSDAEKKAAIDQLVPEAERKNTWEKQNPPKR